MTTRSWIRRLFDRKACTVRKAPACFRPALEGLEDRLTPAFLTVTSLADNTNPVITTAANSSPAGSQADPYQAPSLRSAISYANTLAGSSTITLPSSLFPDDESNPFGPNPNPAIQLSGSQLPTITANVSIVAANDPYVLEFAPLRTLAISGQNQSRVFQVGPTGTLSLTNLVIENGYTTDNGGGILNQGSLTLENVTVSSNLAGIQQHTSSSTTGGFTTTTVTYSVVSAASGGGIYNSGPSLLIEHSTITGNQASVSGAGVWTSGANATFNHDTISNNILTGADHSTDSTSANPLAGGSVEGGGIDITAGSVSISFSTIDSNAV
jgi:hypothetical protein